MPRPRLDKGKTLLKLIADAGGSLTQNQIRIARHSNWSAADIAQAVAQCTGLLEVSQAHVKGSKRVCRRITLKLQGWAAVAELQPGYRPARLTTAELKAAVAALQQERDQWALSLLRDGENAMRWRRHEAEVKDKKRKCKLRTLRKPRSSRPIVNGIPSTPRIEAPASVLPPGGFCEACHMNAEHCHCQNPIPGRISDASYYRPSPYTDVRPTMQSTPSNSALAEKIKAAGYTVRKGLVLYGGDRWITPEEWMAKESYRLGS